MADIAKQYADLLKDKKSADVVLASPYKWEKVDPAKAGEKNRQGSFYCCPAGKENLNVR